MCGGRQINSLTRATGAAQRVVGLMDSMPEEDSKPGIEAVPSGEVHYDNVRHVPPLPPALPPPPTV